MPREATIHFLFLILDPKNPILKMCRRLVYEVNVLGRVLGNSIMCLQALKGCFHVEKQLSLAREGGSYFLLWDCYMMASFVGVTLIKKTNVRLGFIDCQDGPPPTLKGRWEWMLSAEFEYGDC